MFIDYAKIYVKSGRGGDGHISFRRELYVPNGGPDGGDGGNGGSIIFKVDDSLNTLLPFKHKYKYEAEPGEEGKAKRMHGKNGNDLIIKVPNGTLIKDSNTNKIIKDMTNVYEDFILLQGGRGGLGNMHFATSKMQAPRYAKPGEKARELYLTLELKVLADVGLVGFPNVGKSSIISAVSNAKPEINNYHFTTINPHLGVVSVYDKSFVMADIPGIIEGASSGQGLGFKFLKHIERTKVLLHVVDIAEVEGRDSLNDLDIIMDELKIYNIDLVNKKQLIALNKIDSIDSENLKKNIDKFKKKYKNIDIVLISALTKQGIEELKIKLLELVESCKDISPIYDNEVEIDELFDNSNNDLIINKTSNNTYEISGEKIKKMLGYTNLDTERGLAFLQKFLNDNGIIKELKKKGLSEGDTVKLYGNEFEYYE